MILDFRGSFITEALETKFDGFNVGSVFRKLTYPIGHRRFAKNPNPMLKARIWISNGVLQFPLYLSFAIARPAKHQPITN